MPVFRIFTERGTEILVVNNFRFARSGIVGRNGNIRWQCTTKTRTKCRARMTTYGGIIIKSNLCHNHSY